MLFLSSLLLLDCNAGERIAKSFGLWGRTISNGDIEIYKPFGFVAHIDENGTIEIGMADVSIGLDVFPMRSAAEIDEAHERIERITRMSRGTSNSQVEMIEWLGAVKGHGIRWKIDFPSSDLREEEIAFVTEGPTRWSITASCRIFDDGQKRIYAKIVSSVARTVSR